jgi:plastocyanin
MTDELVFDPDSVTIAPGDTIEWVNVGTVGHSVTAYEDEIPEEAEYFASGDLSSEQEARDSYPDQGDVAGGESYSHTFEVAGEYGYFCIPHESVGMVAEVIVEEGGGEAAGGAGGPPAVPESALSLAIATAVAMVSIVGFAYIFLKYGGDYGEEGTGGGQS